MQCDGMSPQITGHYKHYYSHMTVTSNNYYTNTVDWAKSIVLVGYQKAKAYLSILVGEINR